MAKRLFLVYEIDTESRTAPHAASHSRRGPNGFPAEPTGAYFAESTTQACELAAEQHGRAGVYGAVDLNYKKIQLTADELPDSEIDEITSPPEDRCDELVKAIRGLKPKQDKERD